jgi:hypothetical protein
MIPNIYTIVISGAILISIILLLFAFTMVWLSNSDVNKIWLIPVFLFYFGLLLTVDYLWILTIIDYGLLEDQFLNSIFGLPMDYQEHIWFSLGGIEVNYSIFRTGFKMISYIAVIIAGLGYVTRFIVNLFSKK